MRGCVAQGSSPLTRGKLRRKRSPILRHGLIPAHAGKTRLATKRARPSTAHPRSRGENLIGVAADLSAQGSSPLTRGKLEHRHDLVPTGRLIPAHAGKTRRLVGRLRLLRAHPRSRGENARADDNGSVCLGSSPLTRGKRPHLHVRVFDHGLIPAHAGKTGQGARPSGPWRAHPRSRGENQNGEDTTPPKKGSSPLTRGKRSPERLTVLRLRLIPAHAGKTSLRDGDE